MQDVRKSNEMSNIFKKVIRVMREIAYLIETSVKKKTISHKPQNNALKAQNVL